MEQRAEEHQSLKPFFERWEASASTEEDCLSVEELVAYAEQPSSGHTDHVDRCDLCQQIIQLLSTSATSNGQLHAFLAHTKQKALETAPERPSSTAGYLAALFSIFQPNWVWASAIGVLVIAIGTAYLPWLHPKPIPQTEAFSLEEDKMGRIFQDIKVGLDRVSTLPLSEEQLQQEETEINGKVDEFNTLVREGKVGSTERANVGELLAKFRIEQLEQYQAIENSRAFAGTPIQIRPTPDSENIIAIYTAVDQALAGSLIDSSTAHGVPRATPGQSAKQIDCEEATGEKLVVRDLVPNRVASQKDVMDRAIEGVAAKNGFAVAIYRGDVVKEYRNVANVYSKKP